MKLAARLVWLLPLTLALGASGCSGCGASASGYQHLDLGADARIDSLVVLPAEVTLEVMEGAPAPTQAYQVFAHTTDGDLDVTSEVVLTLYDPSLGSFAGPVLTATTQHGGTTTLLATARGLTGQATVHVRFHKDFGNQFCPGCPPLPPDGTPSCADPARSAQLVYPPDNVLVPPNLPELELQYLPGRGDTVWQVRFENPATDVRAQIPCTPVDDARGATNGCGFALPDAVWTVLAQSNRGGDPIVTTIRSSADGSCLATSNERRFSLADEDVKGTLYYWQSVTVGGVAGRTGGIFREDFGTKPVGSQPFLTPTIGACVGCHFVSRDGTRMTFGSDDDDSDDECRDQRSNLLDVAQKVVLQSYRTPGFQSFSAKHDWYLGSDCNGDEHPGVLQAYQGDGDVSMGITTNARATQPDWAADDSQAVFVIPKSFVQWNGEGPNPLLNHHVEDTHFAGGSLWTMDYQGNGNFTAPTLLMPSLGDNYYYPSYSPDGSFIIFDKVAQQASDLESDCFNNPQARIQILSTIPGAKAIDCGALNDTGALTNSWPRWSPFVQMHKGKRLQWVTFSSTRDYGLRVRNHVKVADGSGQLVDQINCYPPDSPQNPTGSHTDPLPLNCNQPQIWMAAVDLTTAEQYGDGRDPSYPAFWLPGQDRKAHNHTAQWAEGTFGQGNPDGGSCIPDDQPCTANPSNCCNGVCLIGSTNRCGIP